MKRFVLFVVLVALAGMVTQCAGADPALNLKMYVFDSGRLKSGNPQPLIEHGLTTTDMSVRSYLIVHPKGTLVWDTGVIPDDMVGAGGATYLRATVEKTLTSQLAEVGYKPSDIKHLALSHYHYDHSANAGLFTGAEWLVQKAEREMMFSGKLGASSANSPTPEETAKRFDNLRNNKTTELTGDHDVFGDGSVVIVATPGHTPGHQSLLVNLPKTGPVLLTGDLYHYPAEVESRDFTPFAGLGDPKQEEAAKAKVDVLLKEKKAALWIQHDLIADANVKKSPQFYE